jgi:hypothetical protein
MRLFLSTFGYCVNRALSLGVCEGRNHEEPNYYHVDGRFCNIEATITECGDVVTGDETGDVTRPGRVKVIISKYLKCI